MEHSPRLLFTPGQAVVDLSAEKQTVMDDRPESGPSHLRNLGTARLPAPRIGNGGASHIITYLCFASQ
jgi:hypothetical protein